MFNAYLVHKGDKKKDSHIRTQFESGAFSQSNKDFSRDLQALDLEGMNSAS